MTERENFDKWVFSHKSNGYPLRNPHDALLAWEACAEQKQAEIDALRKELEVQSYWGMRWEQEHEINISLRKELEQVKMHNVIFAKAVEPFSKLLDDTSGPIPTGRLSFSDWHCLSKANKATSEQVEAYRAEIIAQAKEEQREADALKCECNFSIEGIAEDCAAAIRNNKE